jgi:D-alanyl-D-alanine carboxypeptidase/D-alanyl-D-alanine-endopeptidase (penicillin-binding protein 4)
VIRDINKFSNNVMARQLFLTLSLAVDAPPLSTDRAARAVREWARRVDLDLPELVIENGSGLSRIERISARGLARVLLRGMSAPLMPEYLASLPIPGIDGTLRRRLNASPASGQAHIKTGYLDGVRAIAGYVLDQQGRWLVVVAIINHPSAINAQGFQDAVIEWAYSGDKPGRCCGP